MGMKRILTLLFSLLTVTGLRAANPSFTDMHRFVWWTNDQGTIHLKTNTSRLGFTDTNTFIFSDGLDNFGIGLRTGAAFRFGIENTHVGVRSGTVTRDGSDNTGTGFRALEANLDGSNNTADGAGALQNLIDGNSNTGGGKETLGALTSGSDNTGYGFNVLDNSALGERNTGMGRESLHFLGNSDENVGIGYRSGYQSEASYGTYLGARADQVDFPGTKTNCTAIGWRTKVGRDNTVELSNELVDQVRTAATIIASNSFASYSTLATNQIAASGWTNNAGNNVTVYVTVTAVAFTIKNRAGTVMYTSPTLTTTLPVTLQPGWAINAASGLTGTVLPW